MTASELEVVIRGRLREAGLLAVVDEYKSQFLEFPDGLFAELVLSDGSKLVDTERIGREIRDSLKKQSVDLDVVVRSIWTVKEIGDPSDWVEKEVIDPRAPSGVSWPFIKVRAVPVVLTSGSATREVEVDVVLSAVDEIKRRIEGQGLDEKDAVKKVVREFVDMQLSLGGESYWDPIRYPQQELSEGALLYLFGHWPVEQNSGIQGSR